MVVYCNSGSCSRRCSQVSSQNSKSTLNQAPKPSPGLQASQAAVLQQTIKSQAAQLSAQAAAAAADHEAQAAATAAQRAAAAAATTGAAAEAAAAGLRRSQVAKLQKELAAAREKMAAQVNP